MLIILNSYQFDLYLYLYLVENDRVKRIKSATLRLITMRQPIYLNR